MTGETTRSRIRKVLAGEKPADRLPLIEWASWWDLSTSRWRQEGMPDLDKAEIKRFFGLDMDYQYWLSPVMPGAPLPEAAHGGGLIRDEADYDRILSCLYPDTLQFDRDVWQQYAREQAEGSAVIWMTLNGFFWWPRVLLGIEPHLFAFYDQPELMQRICRDVAEWQIARLDDFCRQVAVPDFITFAEDMSYNHGPMLSRQQFDACLAPWYRLLVPRLKEYGITVIVDSDGDIEPLIPWLASVGVEGILPLERMAGVDVNRIREQHPQWRMIGGFDKTVMHLGEEAMRTEFKRLLPAMRSGYYIPSVDHQTPPAVSIDDYRLYVSLLREYARIAVE